MPMMPVAAAVFITGCAAPSWNPPVDLEQNEVLFNNARVTVVLVDEFGAAIPGYRVDVSWQEPSFYKTSAFTNRQGEVTFAGLPEVVEISIDYPAGVYHQTFVVPPRGRQELRVMLDTLGENELRSARERRVAPRVSMP